LTDDEDEELTLLTYFFTDGLGFSSDDDDIGLFFCYFFFSSSEESFHLVGFFLSSLSLFSFSKFICFFKGLLTYFPLLSDLWGSFY